MFLSTWRLLDLRQPSLGTRGCKFSPKVMENHTRTQVFDSLFNALFCLQSINLLGVSEAFQFSCRYMELKTILSAGLICPLCFPTYLHRGVRVWSPASSMGTTWGLVRNANHQPHSRPTESGGSTVQWVWGPVIHTVNQQIFFKVDRKKYQALPIYHSFELMDFKCLRCCCIKWVTNRRKWKGGESERRKRGWLVRDTWLRAVWILVGRRRKLKFRIILPLAGYLISFQWERTLKCQRNLIFLCSQILADILSDSDGRSYFENWGKFHVTAS